MMPSIVFKETQLDGILMRSDIHTPTPHSRSAVLLLKRLACLCFMHFFCCVSTVASHHGCLELQRAMLSFQRSFLDIPCTHISQLLRIICMQFECWLCHFQFHQNCLSVSVSVFRDDGGCVHYNTFSCVFTASVSCGLI